MGYFNSLTAFIKGDTPAMEADDITQDIEDQKQSVLGSGAATQSNQDDDAVQDDPSKTNDIFGLKETDKNDETDPSDPGADTNADDEPTDEGGEEPGEDDMGNEDDPNNGDDNTGGEYAPDDMDSAPPVNPTEIEKLEHLRTNMINFYEVIENNLSLLADNTPDVIIPEQADVVGKVTENLTECKNLLFSEIKEGFKKKTYADLMYTYTAIQRAYDLSSLMLEKHFESLHSLAFKPKKKKRTIKPSTTKKPNPFLNPKRKFANPSMPNIR